MSFGGIWLAPVLKRFKTRMGKKIFTDKRVDNREERNNLQIFLQDWIDRIKLIWKKKILPPSKKKPKKNKSQSFLCCAVG